MGINYYPMIFCNYAFNCFVVVLCSICASSGTVSINCLSRNGNPIVNRTCTVAGSAIMTIPMIVPCKLNFNHCFNVTHSYINRTGNITDTFRITTIDYQPGIYTITFNYTDIYGQTFQAIATVHVSLSRMCY